MFNRTFLIDFKFLVFLTYELLNILFLNRILFVQNGKFIFPKAYINFYY